MTGNRVRTSAAAGVVGAAALVFVFVWGLGSSRPADAQEISRLVKLTWYGPIALTDGETARFNYTNFGNHAVLVRWAFSHAITGVELVGNLDPKSKAALVGPMQGIKWDLSGAQLREREGKMGGMFFDQNGRAQLLGWLYVQHASQQSMKEAVDLGSVEMFDNGTGRSSLAVMANPTAPGDTRWIQTIGGSGVR